MDPDILDHAVLALLLARHPTPVHEADLGRAFDPDDWQSSVAALREDGVVHREGALLLLARPAVRVAELLG